MPRPAPPIDSLVVALTEQRRLAGRTQRDLAAWIGVDRSSLTGWEAGRSYPPLPRLHLWAAALGYTITITPTPGTSAYYEHLIAERDRLILLGVNPDELAIPLPP